MVYIDLLDSMISESILSFFSKFQSIIPSHPSSIIITCLLDKKVTQKKKRRYKMRSKREGCYIACMDVQEVKTLLWKFHGRNW